MIILRQNIYSIPKPAKPNFLKAPTKPISTMPSPGNVNGLVGNVDHVQQAKVQGNLKVALRQQQDLKAQQKLNQEALKMNLTQKIAMGGQ